MVRSTIKYHAAFLAPTCSMTECSRQRGHRKACPKLARDRPTPIRLGVAIDITRDGPCCVGDSPKRSIGEGNSGTRDRRRPLAGETTWRSTPGSKLAPRPTRGRCSYMASDVASRICAAAVAFRRLGVGAVSARPRYLLQFCPRREDRRGLPAWPVADPAPRCCARPADGTGRRETAEGSVQRRTGDPAWRGIFSTRAARTRQRGRVAAAAIRQRENGEKPRRRNRSHCRRSRPSEPHPGTNAAQTRRIR